MGYVIVATCDLRWPDGVPPRARSNPDLVATGGSAAAVLDFAVAQIMRDDTALGALPAVLAMYPPDSVDEALLARIGATLARQDTVVAATEPRASVLLVLLGAGRRPAPVRPGPDRRRGGWTRRSGHRARGRRHRGHADPHANDMGLERRSLADQTERLNCLIAAAIPGVLFTDEQGRSPTSTESFGTLFGMESPDRLVGHGRRRPWCAGSSGCSPIPDEFVRRTSEVAQRPPAGRRGADAVRRRPHPGMRLLAGAGRAAATAVTSGWPGT